MAVETNPRRSLRGALLAAALLAATFGAGPGPAPTPTSAAGPTFTVNSLGDEPDANVGNGVCATAGAKCTLRAALQEANFNVDANTITFSVVGTIILTAELPVLSSGIVTIAGTNQAVTIDGSSLSGWWTACLHLTSDGNTVKGLVIANCRGNGIQLDGGSNVIGGTAASERNVIRDYEQVGVYGSGSSVTGNQILGNQIAGDPAWEGDWQGILLGDGASGNTIGGSSPGARNVISGGQTGVWLMGAGSNNVIQGNYIGLDATGSFAVPNGTGVEIGDGASGNTVLDNVIGGNNGAGILVGGLFYNLSGSQTDFWGQISLDGHIRTALPGWSAEQEAVDGTMYSWFFHANKGNVVEIEVSALDDGCGSVGPIWLTHIGSSNNVLITPGVSHTCPGAGETIFHWSQPINIPNSPSVASGNVIQGNRIGTNAAGDNDIPNNGGIRVMGSSSDTQIGGAEPGDGNLISGNYGTGISISGDSQNDVVQGNYIGVDESGTTDLPNQGVGIDLGSLSDYSGAVGTLVGGEDAGARNVIGGNGGAGIEIWFSTHGVSIEGNHIGTNAAGDEEIGNGNQGVVMLLSAHDNTVGGDSAAERNVISGNAWAGIEIWWGSNNNVVEGNYIGLSADGSTALPNGSQGVDLYDGASGNEVLGNVISGNDADGVSVGENQYSLSGDDSDIFAEIDVDDHIEVTWAGEWGIFSGDEEDGSVGSVFFRGNPTWPLHLEVTSDDACASVGPIWLHHLATGAIQLTEGEDNGCTGESIVIPYTIAIPEDYSASGNVIEDNRIGTNPAGDAVMTNQGSGISLRGSSDNTTIGSPWHGNVISGNRYLGIQIGGGSVDDIIQGNYIGVNAAGNAPLPNEENGIYFEWTGAGVGTIIGGSGPGQGNVISGNGFNGVDLSNGAHDIVVQGNFIGTNTTGTPLGNGHNGVIAHEGARDNLIGGTAASEGNVIAHNHYSGVDIGGASSVHNTIRGNSVYSNWGSGIGLWNGGNASLPAPVISLLDPVRGTACPNCIVDVYSDAEGEGRIYHGWTLANGAGNFTYSGAVSGPAVTATATDAAGNTSRFSEPVLVPGAATVHIGSMSVAPGGQTTVGLSASNVPSPGLGAFTIDVTYDSAVVTPTGCDPDPDGHFDGSFCNTSFAPSTIRVGGFRTAAGAVDDLSLCDITFQAVGLSGSQSPLTLSLVEFADTLGQTIPAATESGMMTVGVQGDANGDGKTSMVDAMLIAQCVVGLIDCNSIDQEMADVNCSGGVSMVDAMLVAQKVVGLIGAFPACGP